MPERMYGPVLLMAAFFGAVVLLMVLLTPVIYAGIDTGETATASRIHDLFSESMYWDQWEPDTYTVTDESTTGGWNAQANKCVQFEPAGGTDFPLECSLIRNASLLYERDTADYWWIWQWYGWFGGKLADEFLSLDEIEANWDDQTNMSSFILGLRFTVQVIFWVDNLTGSESFRDRLDNNLYNVSAGISTNDTMDSISPWTMLGKIMSFRMPGTNFVTNALIAIPIYTALIYIAFAIIRSVIPLLGG